MGSGNELTTCHFNNGKADDMFKKTERFSLTKGYASLRPKTRDTIAGYGFLSLYIIGLLVFTAYPFITSFYYSLTDYNTLYDANFIGFQNYIKMFTEDKRFWVSFWVTAKFSLIGVPLKLVFSLLVAVILSKKTKLTNFYRSVFYVPSLLGGGVAVAITWKQLWEVDGVFNHLIGLLGIPPHDWLTDPNTALSILILLGMWAFGSQMLVFLAAINEVPVELHEAAILDGANSVQRFFKITLPMITPSLFFNLINGIIGSLQAFNSAYLITGGQPLNSTLFYGLYQYRQGFTYHNMGYAAAMAWFLLLVIVALTAITFKSSSTWVYYQGED